MMWKSCVSTRNVPTPGPSKVPDVQERSDDGYRSSSTLYDIFVLFTVPTNVIIPAIYLMKPAFRALMTADKLPATKGLSIAIIAFCLLILCYAVPKFLFWLITKAQRYKIIRIKRRTLMDYGLNIE